MKEKRMKRNGMYVLHFNVPAIVGRQLIYLRGKQFLGRVTALCFLPYAGLLSTEEIDNHAEQFEAVDTTLVIVSSGARPLHRLWADEPAQPRTAVLGDLCGRLHRLFGVKMSESSAWCHTFIIDGEGILRLRLTHHFVERDLDRLRQMMAKKVSVTADGYPSASVSDDDRTECFPDESTKSFMNV
jgi:alkyl hydroperoxide reductase subunit AhpC